MKIGSAFPTTYLQADEVAPECVLTIKDVVVETVGQGQQAEQKPVVYFFETPKGLVLNKTNASNITVITGTDETDGWRGKSVCLFKTTTEFGGKTVPCIRVKEAALPSTPPMQQVGQALPPGSVPPVVEQYNETTPPPITANPLDA
jgi:hypothetical protein